MDREELKNMTLLAKAAETVFGKTFDLRDAEDIEAIRKLAKSIAEAPDSEESERILDLMQALDPSEPELIHITPGVGVQRVQRFIPERERVLKKGRSYGESKRRGFDISN